jgi:hypothetical protein
MRLGKANVQVSGLLGRPYGTVFEVQGKQLVATANAELYEDIVIDDSASCHIHASCGVGTDVLLYAYTRCNTPP